MPSKWIQVRDGQHLELPGVGWLTVIWDGTAGSGYDVRVFGNLLPGASGTIEAGKQRAETEARCILIESLIILG